MADSDEEDEVGDIDPPEDRSDETGDSQPLAVLGEVGIDSPEDDHHENGGGKIKRFACLLDRLEKKGVLFYGELFFFHHIPSDR